MQGIGLQPPGKKLEDRFVYPLTYEPGSERMYGPSIDWTGRIVERLNGGMKLETYMKQNIWERLRIKNMTFYLQDRPDMIAMRADMSERDPGGSGKVVYVDDAYWHEYPTDALGGMAIFSTPEDYMKVMYSLLANDGKLLKPETVDLMFEPQLSDSARQSLMKFYEAPIAVNMMGALLPAGVKKDHGLGGMLLMEDLADGPWRKKGTMCWSGLPNVFWVCAFILQLSLPLIPTLEAFRPEYLCRESCADSAHNLVH